MTATLRRAAVLAATLAMSAATGTTGEPEWHAKAAALPQGTASGTIDIDGKTIALRHAYAARHEAGGDTIYWIVLLASAPMPSDKLQGEKFTDFGHAPAGPSVRLDCIEMSNDVTCTVNVNGGRQAIGGVEAETAVNMEPERFIGWVVAPAMRLDVSFHAGPVLAKPKM